MDRIFIRGLQERLQPTRLQVDMVLFLDLRAAGSSDDLTQTVDYAEVVAWIHEFARHSHCQLLETLAEGLCESVFARTPHVGKIEIALFKVGVLPHLEAVGIQIERTRQNREGAQ
jgi:dihydroneopterin aldolase